MARPRTPTNVLAMRGAFDKDPKRGRSRENEPGSTGEIGEPPVHLGDGAKVCWREIVAITAPGVLVKSDRMALEIASELMAAKRSTPGGLLHPAMLIRLTSLLASFGMTPADRSKVSAPKQLKANPFAALASKGKKA
jgi:phage terminase small subunit